MSKLDRLFVKSYIINEDIEKEFFDCIRDYCYTEEFISTNKNIQHGNITVHQHIYSVAYISYKLSKKLGFDYRITARGALLHDLFYYDWHDPDPSHRLHGYYHPGFALKNARELSKKVNVELTEKEENIIIRHMFPLTPIPPKYRESILVSLVDKYVATKEIFICRSPALKKRLENRIENMRSEYLDNI